MANVDGRKHGLGRLEGLLFKGSQFLQKGITRPEYFTWKDSVLYFVAKVFGHRSTQYQSLVRVCFNAAHGQGGLVDSKLSGAEMMDRLRLATSLLYKYINEAKDQDDTASEYGIENEEAIKKVLL